MNTKIKMVLAVAIRILMATPAVHAVPLSITLATLLTGTGYGVEVSENPSANLHDVRFTNVFNMQHFELNAINDSFSFDLGKIDFRERDVNLAVESNSLNQMASACPGRLLLPIHIMQRKAYPPRQPLLPPPL